MTAKWPTTQAKLVEDKANGPAVIQMLRREIPGLISINPVGGKVVRAQAVSPDVEAGNVYLPLPEIAPWVHDFITGNWDGELGDSGDHGVYRQTIYGRPNLR